MKHRIVQSLRKQKRTVRDKAPLWAQPCTHILNLFAGPLFYADSESAIIFGDFPCKHYEKCE